MYEKGIYESSVKQSFWESPIWIHKTNFDKTFNKELLKELYNIANNVKHGLDSNVGSSLLDYLDGNPRLNQLIKLKEEVITNTVSNYLPKAHKAVFSPLSSWLNVKEPEEVIELHGHPDSTIASTYYITTPEKDGELYYLDTGIVGEHKTNIKYIKPSAGDLVFFPSYILHGIKNNGGNSLRVSLSTDFNYKLTDDSKDKLVLTSWVDSMIKIKQLI